MLGSLGLRLRQHRQFYNLSHICYKQFFFVEELIKNKAHCPQRRLTKRVTLNFTMLLVPCISKQLFICRLFQQYAHM